MKGQTKNKAEGTLPPKSRNGKSRNGTAISSHYIVVDPAICHGQATFRDTRILVCDVLEQVASGMDWTAIIDEWRGSITREAIAEAVRLKDKGLLPSADKSLSDTSQEISAT